MCAAGSRSRGDRHRLANCSCAEWLIDSGPAGYLTQMTFTGVHPSRDATASAIFGFAADHPPVALAALSLSKRFGSRLVGDQVSFDAGAGRIHGLLGSNGAGKTTTMRMLLDVVFPAIRGPLSAKPAHCKRLNRVETGLPGGPVVRHREQSGGAEGWGLHGVGHGSALPLRTDNPGQGHLLRFVIKDKIGF